MGPKIVFHYFPSLNQQQREKIERLYPLYKDWNDKINVISRKDIEELYVRHVLHSLAIAKFISFQPEAKILDIGTGGGFPGIPLAIFFPKTHFLLVDSIGKKIKVVSEIASELKLDNISAEHQRAEKAKGPFDFIVSRAVARTKLLYQWTHQKISSENKHSIDNGFLLLKGGDLREELKEFGRPHQQISISDYFKEDFFETKKVIYIPN